jgi:ABC-type multidrug transport system permease subunit
MKGFLALLLRELLITKHRLPRFLASWTVMPLLYMLAFGWGMGREVTQEGMPYIAFLVPGLLAMGTMTHSFAIASELNITRFYWKVFDHFQAAPLSFGTIAAAEVTAATARGIAASCIIGLLAVCFGVSIHVGPALVLGLLLNCVIFGSLGVTAAMVVRGHSDQMILANFIITPMSFLCGTVFSLRAMPEWGYYLIHALPLTYSARVIRAAARNGTVQMADIVVLACFAALGLGLARWAVGRARQ